MFPWELICVVVRNILGVLLLRGNRQCFWSRKLNLFFFHATANPLMWRRIRMECGLLWMVTLITNRFKSSVKKKTQLITVTCDSRHTSMDQFLFFWQKYRIRICNHEFLVGHNITTQCHLHNLIFLTKKLPRIFQVFVLFFDTTFT